MSEQGSGSVEAKPSVCINTNVEVSSEILGVVLLDRLCVLCAIILRTRLTTAPRCLDHTKSALLSASPLSRAFDFGVSHRFPATSSRRRPRRTPSRATTSLRPASRARRRVGACRSTIASGASARRRRRRKRKPRAAAAASARRRKRRRTSRNAAAPQTLLLLRLRRP